MSRSLGGLDVTSNPTTLVLCAQIEDRRGNVLGFTEHDEALSRDISDGNGTIVYNPEASFNRSAIEARSGGRSGSADFIGFLDSAGITEAGIFSGRYDSALFRIFLTDWTDSAPASGIIWIDIGELEETNVSDDQFTVSFKSLLDRYQSIKIGNYYSDDCIHVVGSQPTDIPPPFGKIGCRVQLDPPVWSGGQTVVAREDRNARPAELSGSPTILNTVKPTDLATVGRYFESFNAGTTGGSEPAWGTLPARDSQINDNGVLWIARQELTMPVGLVSSADQSNLRVSYTGDAPDNWYQRGRIVCTRGANIGIGIHIKTASYTSPSDGTLEIVTWLPFPLALDAGSPNDEFTLFAGCDRRAMSCIFKFRNFRNWGGFSLYAPIRDEYFRIPKQTS